MTQDLVFSINRLRFDENYQPTTPHEPRLTLPTWQGASVGRTTRNALKMMNNRLNSLLSWDNPTGDRYQVEVDIVSAVFR